MAELGLLRITESETIEITANTARLHITIKGDNFIYGNAAIEKCKEVKTYVEKAKLAGIADDAIKVKSVRVKIVSGLLSRSSSAIYNIAITVNDLSKLGDLLGLASDSKTISIDWLEWKYEEDAARFAACQAAMKKAKKKAELMMSCADYRIVGIKFCTDRYESNSSKNKIPFGLDPDMDIDMENAAMEGMKRRSMARVSDIGTEFKGSKEITAEVTVDFTIDSKGT